MQSKQTLQPVMLSCRHVRKTYDEKEILTDITFTLRQGEKVGVVGPNGSGKTTLFRLLVGELVPESGTITRAPHGEVAYFPQTHEGKDLSGGELAKKVLAPLMRSSADTFLLDEPTNNLDEEGLAIVEKFVQDSPHSFLIVSHDRTFLDHTVSRILSLDAHTKSARLYDGNYSAYAQEREAETARAWEAHADTVQHTKKLRKSIDQRLSWMKNIEKTRRTIHKLPIHEKEKPVAAILRDQEGRMGRRARIVKDRLESFSESEDVTPKPKYEIPLKIQFEETRGSTKVFDLKAVEKTMGVKNIGPLTYSIQHGERVHVCGKNGAGKTTLLTMLLGELPPDAGIIEKGENVHIGYVPQTRWLATDEQTVLEHFTSVTNFEETEARKVLHRFRLETDDVHKALTQISPGEFTRLILAELVAQKPNCIILDEPSNHLDLEALEELEHALAAFTGTLIVVSHDRYFVEKIRLTKVLSIV